MKCKNCGAELPKGAKQCPECGQKRSHTGLWITLIIAIALVLLLIIGTLILLLAGGAAAILLLDTTHSPAPAVEAPTQSAVAHPLSEDNPYRECYDSYPDFVLPDSDSRYLTKAALESLSDQALTVALHELAARHGAVAPEAALQEYFQARSWYTAGGEYTPNDYERTNRALLEAALRQRCLLPMDEDNPYPALVTGDYLLPESSSRRLSGSELAGLSPEALTLAFHEILARQGQLPADDDLLAHFCATDWFTPLPPQTAPPAPSQVEGDNLQLIELYRRRAAGVSFSPDNPYAPYLKADRDYILPQSSARELHDGDLMALQPAEYTLARNEIMARHGYVFTDPQLLEYFLQCSWYCPNGSPGSTEGIRLTAIEEKNAQLLRQLQDIVQALPEVDRLSSQLSVPCAGNGFSVLVPEYWTQYAFIEADDRMLRFEEQLSRDTCGGHIFTLMLFTDDQFSQMPSYDHLGMLTDSQGNNYQLVALYPTDVQFVPAAAELYSHMSLLVPQILQTVTAAPGYTFTPLS